MAGLIPGQKLEILQAAVKNKQRKKMPKDQNFRLASSPLITVLQLMQGGFRKKRKKGALQTKGIPRTCTKKLSANIESGQVNKQCSRKSVMDGKELIASAQASLCGLNPVSVYGRNKCKILYVSVYISRNKETLSYITR